MTTSPFHCLTPSAEASFEGFFLETLSEVGSMNLVLAISSDDASLKMLESLHKITSGLLLLNAVYYESDHLRFLSRSETEDFYRRWNLPINWLRPEGQRLGAAKSREARSPVSLLQPLLLAHQISHIIATDPRVFSWAFQSPRDAQIYSVEPSVLDMASAI